jgi:hypothetical protein
MLRSFLRILPLALLPALALAQGTLDPSGAPAPAMKSLDQLEPRIPIGKVGGSTGQIVIDHPGSYVLMGDLTATGGAPIILMSGDVTVDLNGFTVTAPDLSSGITGMVTDGDIVIRNGRIVGTTSYDGKAFTTRGSNCGISFAPFAGTCTISDITVRGMQSAGVYVPSYPQQSQRTTVRRCTVSVCAGEGIVASTIADSTAETCGSTALSALVVTNSIGICVGTGSGIRAYTVTNSYGQSQSAFGIDADNNNAPHLGTATNCRGVSATGTGLFATAATNCIGISTSGTGLDTNSDANGFTGTATGCVGRSTSGHGLIASIATNCHGATTASTMYGLWVSGTATGCRGTNTAAAGIAVRTDIAVGCTAAAGTITANSKQLGTP